MTHSPPTASSSPTDSPGELRAIRDWLARPAQPDIADELTALLSNLNQLRGCYADQEYRSDALTGIYRRSIDAVERVLPSLTSISFPVSGKQRQTVRTLQDLLHKIAEGLASTRMIESATLSNPTETLETALCRSMQALSYHLLISHLAAVMPVAGVWQLLHANYGRIRDRSIEGACPTEAAPPHQDLYFSAIFLACALPASFSSRETRLIADYLLQHSKLIHTTDKPDENFDCTFWIDAARDAPATSCSRGTAPSGNKITYFNCDRLVALIRKQLAALRSGTPPEQIEAPDFARTPAARGALRRLADLLENPAKRRFPRRRQHYRATLCAGLESLWSLFSQGAEAELGTSSWMVTNESAEGYAIMHVLGKTSDVSVGDIVAIKTETGDNWQVCITRWTQSENREHLEFGLQILATNAIPAMLALMTESKEMQYCSNQHAVLILPKVLPLRLDEMLVIQSGLIEEQPKHLVLVIEQENIEVREVKSTRLSEQNGHIEIFSIEAGSHPDLVDTRAPSKEPR